MENNSIKRGRNRFAWWTSWIQKTAVLNTSANGLDPAINPAPWVHIYRACNGAINGREFVQQPVVFGAEESGTIDC